MSKSVSCAFNRVGRPGWGGAWAALLICCALAAPAQNAPSTSVVAVYYDGPAQPLAEGFLDEFLRSREDLVTEWHRKVRGELDPLATSQGWEVLVTMLDSRRIVALMKDVDFTVVPDRSIDGTTLPSARATGTELALTVLAAASASGRAAIYAEHAVAGREWARLGSVLAQSARVQTGRDHCQVAFGLSFNVRLWGEK